MPKPDLALRSRPLKEVQPAIEQLKRVVLIHPEEIVVEMESKFCICSKPERQQGSKTRMMIQCPKCYEWFHYDCVKLNDDFDAENTYWECNWCKSEVDKYGMQRWKEDRKKAKLRHLNDRPVVKGGALGKDPPKSYSAPLTWEGKVDEVKEISRRKRIKKLKLQDCAQELIDQGGHHKVDAEGLNGLEARPPDDALIDELIAAGIIDPENMGDD
jgi:hypothetical protein